ncbi:MAG: alpha/beta fold hydrolase [Bacteroides sp.]|nr:alpha/beta fold hydrolase [Bacteroides sp.]
MKKLMFLLLALLLPAMYSCEEKSEFHLMLENLTGESYWTDEENKTLIHINDGWLFFYYQGTHGFIPKGFTGGEGDEEWEWIGSSFGNFTIHDVYNENEMKISFHYYPDGQNSEIIIECPPIKIHRVNAEKTDKEVKIFAHRGFNGEIRSTDIEANAVTADGCSQLKLILNDSSHELIELLSFSESSKITTPEYSSDGKYWSMKYTAPNSVTENGEKVADITLLGKVRNKNGEVNFRIYEVPEITIYKMGVGLIHGLFSNAKDCFGGLQNYLISSEGYMEEQVQMIDYRSSNASSFDYNTWIKKGDGVIDVYLNELYNNLLEKGIVSSKYALVGHSMGGILSRLYAQNINPNGVGAIITLDTPHWGSHIADCGGNFVAKVTKGAYIFASVATSRNKSMMALNAAKAIEKMYLSGPFDALRDLASDSKAMKDLNKNTSSGIPVHAINSDMDGFEDVDVSLNKIQSIMSNILPTYKLTMFFHIGAKELLNCEETVSSIGNMLDIFFGDPEHDGIVSGVSQRGGLDQSYCTILKAPYKGRFGLSSDAFHCNTNKWLTTYQCIGNLLKDPINDSRFCTTGFKAPANFDVSVSTRATETGNEEGYTFTEDENTYVSFKTCAVEDVDDTRCIHIELEKSENVISNMVFVEFGKEDDEDKEVNADICRDSYYMEIPKDYKGEAQIYIFGKTENQEYVVEQQTLTID